MKYYFVLYEEYTNYSRPSESVRHSFVFKDDTGMTKYEAFEAATKTISGMYRRVILEFYEL